MNHSSGLSERSLGNAERGSVVTAESRDGPVAVDVNNFVRAESDVYFAKFVKQYGLGRLGHRREPTSIEHQDVVRMNRDTLYSSGVYDLDAGPVNLTLPDTGSRCMMAQVINQDHYTQDIVYAPAQRTFTRAAVEARYMALIVRTMVDPRDAQDTNAAAALQDAILTSQPNGPGHFEIPDWDQTSLSSVRNALEALSKTSRGAWRAFGKKADVDPVHHLIGTATGWGGNPPTAAAYLTITPRDNDGVTRHEVIVKDVPVDGFWSISVYNAEGYFEKNSLDAYSVNNVTARCSPDGSVKVLFGGCGNGSPNCLPIVPGWNCVVRLYRPRGEILDGTWKFPELVPLP